MIADTGAIFCQHPEAYIGEGGLLVVREVATYDIFELQSRFSAIKRIWQALDPPSVCHESSPCCQALARSVLMGHAFRVDPVLDHDLSQIIYRAMLDEPKP